MSGTIAFAPIRKSITVKAAREHAFAVFARGAWWPKKNSLLASPLKETVIEPRAGGRWYERGEDGSECDWGKVLAWEPPARMLLAWQLNGRFQYDPDLITEVEVTFTAVGAKLTRVDLEHRYFERAGDTAEALRQGVDSPAGWSGTLEGFRQEAEAMTAPL
jgi:hypothetical protein